MRSDHPVIWLRIRLLAERARRLGWQETADEIEHDWQNIASLLGLQEDYFGCFDEKVLPALNQTIEDMLTEASPRRVEAEEVTYKGAIDNLTTPPAILNFAWRRLATNSDSYSDWEAEAITAWNGDLPGAKT